MASLTLSSLRGPHEKNQNFRNLIGDRVDIASTQDGTDGVTSTAGTAAGAIRIGADGIGGDAGTTGAGGKGGSIEIYTGAGGAGTSATTSGAPGVGGTLIITLGAGGAMSTLNSSDVTESGGVGGAFTLTAGAGGSGVNGGANAGGEPGAGGAINLTAGVGGAGGDSGTPSNSAAGGDVNLTGGAGGAASASATSGAGGTGGSVLLTGGAGGALGALNDDGSAGSGGSITLLGGAGSDATGVAASSSNGGGGGSIQMNGGNGGRGPSGASTTGNGGGGGAFNINGGTGGDAQANNQDGGAGGDVSIAGGGGGSPHGTGNTGVGGRVVVTSHLAANGYFTRSLDYHILEEFFKNAPGTDDTYTAGENDSFKATGTGTVNTYGQLGLIFSVASGNVIGLLPISQTTNFWNQLQFKTGNSLLFEFVVTVTSTAGDMIFMIGMKDDNAGNVTEATNAEIVAYYAGSGNLTTRHRTGAGSVVSTDTGVPVSQNSPLAITFACRSDGKTDVYVSGSFITTLSAVSTSTTLIPSMAVSSSSGTKTIAMSSFRVMQGVLSS